jgi:hypothetical protein
MSRPRAIRRQSHLDRLFAVQDGRCYLCDRPMVAEYRYTRRLGWSADHVNPRTAGFTRSANVLLAHRCCNSKKGSRRARPCELIFLLAVNERLGIRQCPAH